MEAVASAVAVDTAMRAAAVDVHIIVYAKPCVGALGFKDYVFGGDCLWGHRVLPFPKYKNGTFLLIIPGMGINAIKMYRFKSRITVLLAYKRIG